MAYATNDGVALAYERAGDEDGETIVFVEGLGYARWMWDWQREALADDYDLVLWDNRGTGESDEPEGPYTTAEMASDLEAVLEAAEVDRAHVVGASLGGMIAQQYVHDYDRAASVTLLSTTHGGPDAVPIPDETLVRMFEVPDDLDRREAITYKMEPAFTDSFWAANPDVIDDIVDERLESDASDQAREWQGAAAQTFDASDYVSTLDVPALVIHGERDRVVPPENGRQLVEALPDVESVFVDEGGSHLVLIERASLVNDRVRRFVSSV